MGLSKGLLAPAIVALSVTAAHAENPAENFNAAYEGANARCVTGVIEANPKETARLADGSLSEEEVKKIFAELEQKSRGDIEACGIAHELEKASDACHDTTHPKERDRLLGQANAALEWFKMNVWCTEKGEAAMDY